MGIRPRGGSFLVDVTVNGVRRTGTRSSYDQAQAYEAELRADLLKTRGTRRESGDVWTIKQALEKTATTTWSDRTSGTKLTRNAEMAVEFFGPATPLTELTPDRLDDYADYLKSIGNSNATINRKLAAVSRMLTLAVERGRLHRKPSIPRKREGEGRIRFLNEVEEQTSLQLLEQWDKVDHRDAFIVLIDTGMRGGELWRLEGRDCDTEHGLLTIWQTKNGRPRSVPMTERVRAVIERRKTLYPMGPLFPHADNSWFEHLWDRMRTVMGLAEDRQFVPYALRHTCCSRLVQRGVNLRVVQEWMGHKTITVTLRYSHLCPTNLLNAVKVLNGQGRASAF